MALWRRLSRPVDCASVAFFRVAFGLVMGIDAIRNVLFPTSDNPAMPYTIASRYIDPRFHFKYLFFGWVDPWPGIGMYLHFAALGLAAFGIALGWRTRVFAALHTLLFAYLFLCDAIFYQNHYYLIILLSFVLVMVPTDRALSIDARRHPGQETVPLWGLWLLRIQIGIPYFFGAIAKLERDWFTGVPVKLMLDHGNDLAVKLSLTPWAPLAMTWAGFLFDLLIIPALLWKPTRIPAFLAAIFFHSLNHSIFHIGVFPFLMLGATTILFPPDWPRRVPLLKRAFGAAPVSANDETSWPELGRLAQLGLTAYLAIQLLLPFREYLYPGNVDWTEQGQLFAWKMKLRIKRGRVVYQLKDRDDGSSWTVDPLDLMPPQFVSRMAGHPDLVLQFAHHLRDEEAKKGRRVEVYANCVASLNDRDFVPLIDPAVDLAQVEDSLLPASWILPLGDVPLQRPRPAATSRLTSPSP